MIDSTIIHDTLRLIDTVRITDTVSIRDTVITKIISDPDWSGWATGNLIPAIITSLATAGISYLLIRMQRATDIRIAEENRKHEELLSNAALKEQAKLNNEIADKQLINEVRRRHAESIEAWTIQLIDKCKSTAFWEQASGKDQMQVLDELFTTIESGLYSKAITADSFPKYIEEFNKLTQSFGDENERKKICHKICSIALEEKMKNPILRKAFSRDTNEPSREA